MMTTQYILSNDPIGDLSVRRPDQDLGVEISEANAREYLATTDEDIDMARRGYDVMCETIALDALSCLVDGEY